ncbi:hypothetical protein A4R43_03085 [Amycolatopsis albispora]|uniref:Secreted protein n=2 Tax=Amycolatopsis albispora TaxID=1804986 RepID=A0A344L0Q3_9PSEU|nr:hypothetical protein A4R43_03085 [Amycolatopsis albispora]
MAGRFAAALFAGSLTALCLLAPSASAAQRSWSPDPRGPGDTYPGNWHCNTGPYVDACVINSHNGTQPVYKAVMVVKNDTNLGIQLSAPVINMWAGPSTSKQIRDDGCYNSGLSSEYAAACYGTAATLSVVCSIKPGATYVTANAAVNVDGARQTKVSMVEVNC